MGKGPGPAYRYRTFLARLSTMENVTEEVIGLLAHAIQLNTARRNQSRPGR
jgi:hypothetical protein